MSEPVDSDNLKIVIRDPAAWQAWIAKPPTPPEQRIEWCDVKKDPKKRRKRKQPG